MQGLARALIVVNIEWVQIALQNCEKQKKNTILSEVCTINKIKERLVVLFTSDVLYKKYIKGWFTRYHICRQDFVK